MIMALIWMTQKCTQVGDEYKVSLWSKIVKFQEGNSVNGGI